jgi:hypothetical protein
VAIGSLDTERSAGWACNVDVGATVAIGHQRSVNDGHWYATDLANEGCWRVMGGSLTINTVDLTFTDGDESHSGYRALSDLYGRVSMGHVMCTWKPGSAAYMIGASRGSSSGSLYINRLVYLTASSNGWFGSGLPNTKVYFGPGCDLSLIPIAANRIVFATGTGNFGETVANGGTQTVPANIRAGQHVAVTRVANNGTPSTMPLIHNITDGSFDFTTPAPDLSTYSWSVIP